MKKFILTDETIEMFGVTLHRIKAVRSFGNVKEGDLGGFVEKEENISHCGEAWVYDSAWVYGSACVSDSARVYGSARVYDSAWVYGSARVYGSAWVYGSARVYGSAWVYGSACVGGSARVCGEAWVYDSARVYGSARVYDSACVGGSARVYDSARVYGSAWVYDSACVGGSARVCGEAWVSGEADYIVFKNWWSSGRYFTWTRSNNMWSVGCFYGTGEELIKKAYADSEKSGREYERVVKYVESILADESNEKDNVQ